VTFQRVERVDLATPVAHSLRTAILDGTYGPGDFLPPERQLAVEFGVDRNTLRSAIQDLERLGLVQRRQGSGCKVLDYRETATLDLLKYLVVKPGTNEVDSEVVRSAADISLMTFRGIVTLVVERATPADFESVHRAIDELRTEVATDDAQRVFDAHQRLLREFVRAAHSPAAELVLNTYYQVALAAFDTAGTLKIHLGRKLIDEGHLNLVEAAVVGMETGDTTSAHHVADAMLGVLLAAFAAQAQPELRPSSKTA
jgi:GntR family transcriptional repressor for pyruvate dehydrogenase complex